MNDKDTSKEQLINELEGLRQRISGLEVLLDTMKRENQELRRSEERYRTIYTIAPLAFVIWNRYCHVTDWNDKAESLFGWSKEDVLGKNFFQFLIPESERTRVEEVIRVLLKGELPSHAINENLTKNGNNVLCEWNNSILYDSEGNVAEVISLALDITEKKKIEEALKNAKEKLEHKVEERTAELIRSNDNLRKEVEERKQVEEELIKLKDYLDNILESSLDSIVVTDNRGNIRRVNKSFEVMLGYTREELLGNHIVKFTPMREGTYESTTGEWMKIDGSFLDDARVMMIRLVEEKKIRNRESYLLRKDGKVVPTEENIVYSYDEEGKVTGAVGVMRDVTDRKRAEEAKAKIDGKLKDKIMELSITNEISEVLLSTRELNEVLHMILIGATAYQALGFNRALLFLMNEDETMLEGRVATGSLSIEEAYRLWGRLAQESCSLKELLQSRHGELSKEDEAINTLVRQVKIPLKGTESVFTHALFENKSFNITDGLHNPLVDRDFIRTLGTDAFSLVPLISRGKPLGVLLADNFINKKPISDEDVERLRAFANHASLAIENAHLYNTLKEKLAELSAAYQELQESRDKLIRYERLSAMGEVATKLTHEMRNPLTSIGGFARRILKIDLNDDVHRNYISIIVEEISRLEKIVSDILYFAKPAVPVFLNVDLNRTIKSTMELLHSEIEKTNIGVEEHLTFDLPTLLLDENQLRRVIVNLVRNAVDAMPEGGTIIVSTTHNDSWVKVEIADTGIGIVEDDMNKIFDAFYTSKVTGSGLGLTISAQIINSHGGTIEAQRREPRGTIFTIKLPVRKS